MSSHDKRSVRLLMPQWQGGNHPGYPLGARLIAWLAPETHDTVLEVPVEPFHNDASPQDGIAHRAALLQQAREARRLLDEAAPTHIAVIGGDCLVEQAPFAYLNEQYGGELGVLWIDAHPDIKTTGEWPYAHTMVLGNLLGEGDPGLSAEVRVPIKPANVMYAGLREEGLTPQEEEAINRLSLKNSPAEELATSSDAVLRWIADSGVTKLAVHLDLDVLEPTSFRSVLFAEPDPEIDWLATYPAGRLLLPHLLRLLDDISTKVDIVGMGVCEHLPWDAANLRAALGRFPIFS